MIVGKIESLRDQMFNPRIDPMYKYIGTSGQESDNEGDVFDLHLATFQTGKKIFYEDLIWFIKEKIGDSQFVRMLKIRPKKYVYQDDVMLVNAGIVTDRIRNIKDLLNQAREDGIIAPALSCIIIAAGQIGEVDQGYDIIKDYVEKTGYGLVLSDIITEDNLPYIDRVPDIETIIYKLIVGKILGIYTDDDDTEFIMKSLIKRKFFRVACKYMYQCAAHRDYRWKKFRGDTECTAVLDTNSTNRDAWLIRHSDGKDWKPRNVMMVLYSGVDAMVRRKIKRFRSEDEVKDYLIKEWGYHYPELIGGADGATHDNFVCHIYAYKPTEEEGGENDDERDPDPGQT